MVVTVKHEKCIYKSIITYNMLNFSSPIRQRENKLKSLKRSNGQMMIRAMTLLLSLNLTAATIYKCRMKILEHVRNVGKLN
jgi:hypothetical protein